MKIADTHISAPPQEMFWRYEAPQHRGKKVLLLTIGSVATLGSWYGALGEHFIAWCPLPARNREAEANILKAK